MNTKLFHFPGEQEIPSPALIFYRDIIESNTKKAIEVAGGPEHLWPHVKTHKCRRILEMQISMGIRRFKCATAAEAALTAQAGAEHILLAYPLVGPNIRLFLELVRTYPKTAFYALEDDLSQAKELAGRSLKEHSSSRVLIDVNTGMNRTGVSFDRLVSFTEQIASMKGLTFFGFHCYDGNRHEKDFSERKLAAGLTVNALEDCIRTLNREGIDIPDIIMGGSPSFPCYARSGRNIFCSPGTVFVYDAGYTEQFPDLPYGIGAAILTRVVSCPAPGMFTLDTGYKAVSAEQALPGILPEVPNARPAFQSEEHWTWRMNEGHEAECPKVGDLFYVFPWHICPTVALYDEVYAVSENHPAESWTIEGRDRHLFR